MTRLRSTACAALCVLTALGGCYDMTSEVAVVTDATRAESVPTEPGRYCSVDVSFDDLGQPDDLSASDCFALTVDGGRLVVTPDPPDEALTLQAATLARGASLLQMPASSGEGYSLVYAFLRADGVAVLDEPAMTDAIAAAAERNGVTIADAFEIDILAGEPDAVVAFLRDVAGQTFDAALRDPAMARDLKDDALYYVRVGDDETEEDLDAAAALAKVRVLAAAIDRAMALE